ncbi:MAG: hypothetical protein D6717_09970 [Gammaproteobacteria bacterium]|nr:MAG: hypothetical protein D6717_09970 [Gammaproteobacteria bacterium]
MRRILIVLFLTLPLILAGCDQEQDTEQRVVYLELPGSHVGRYAWAVGVVDGEQDGRYKLRIDEIHATPSSDNPLLRSLQRGRYIQIEPDRVLDERAGKVAVAHQQRLMEALQDLSAHVLQPAQVRPEDIDILRREAQGGDNDEIACAVALYDVLQKQPVYRNGELQIDTAAEGIRQVLSVLERFGRYQQARDSLHRPASGDACVDMAVRLIRESDFDLQAHAAHLLDSDTERLREAMKPVRALNHALLEFRTDHFRRIPDGMDPARYEQERLASLTADLRRRYAYNYIRDFRHDINSFKDEKAVIERFQKDKENARVLAELLGGPILDERNLDQDYLNYYRLNRKLPGEMSRALDDDDFYQRALDGFVVVNPTDVQRLEGLRLYLQQFPQGRHAEEARQKITEIEQRLQAPAQSQPAVPAEAAPLPAPVQPLPPAGGQAVPEAPPEIPSMLPEENPRDIPPE